MSQVAIAHNGKGYVVYRTELGRDRQYVGPVWPSPREASRYADLLSVPYTSPLRESGMGSPVGGPSPSGLLPPADAEPMPDAPKGRRRQEDSRE